MIALGGYLILALLLLEVVSRAVRRLGARERIALLCAPLLIVGPTLLTDRTLAPVDQYGYFAPSDGRAAAHLAEARPKYLGFDVFTKFLPWRAAAKAALAAGSIPTWNPGMNCGDPLLGTSEPALAHPFVLASLPLRVTSGFDLVLALTLLLAVLSAYLLFRILVRHRTSALLGALAWMGSDFLVFWLPYPVALSVAPFPFTVLCLWRLARRRAPRDTLRAAVAIALQLLGGHPESALYCFAGATLLTFAVLRRPLGGSAIRFLARLAPAALLGVAFAAVTLIPSLDTMRQSAEHEFRRSVYAHQERSVGWRVALRRWAPNLVPYLYGRSGLEERADRPEFQPPAGVYVGSTALLLAGLGLRAGSMRRLRLGALALLGFGTLVAAKAPGFADLMARLPLFDVSIPEYNLVWGPLVLSMLAALGAEALHRRPAGRLSRWAVALFVVLALPALFSWPQMRAAGLSASFVRSAMLLFLVPAALACVALITRWTPGRRVAALIGILALQRLLEAAPTLPALDPTLLDAYRADLRAFPTQQEPYRVVATGEHMIPNSTTLGGLEDPRGYTALTLAAYAETFPLWSPGGYPLANRIEDLGAPFLAMMNVKYATVAPADPVPLAWSLRSDLAPARVLESSRALPRAFVPAQVALCADRAELMRRLAAETDFSRTAYLEPEDAAPEPCTEAANGRGLVSSRRHPRGLDLQASLEREGWIVVSQAAWRGWVANSGGSRLQVRRANGAFLAIRAPAGESTIELRFAPRSVPIGAGITLVAVAVAWFAALPRRPGQAS